MSSLRIVGICTREETLVAARLAHVALSRERRVEKRSQRDAVAKGNLVVQADADLEALFFGRRLPQIRELGEQAVLASEQGVTLLRQALAHAVENEVANVCVRGARSTEALDHCQLGRESGKVLDQEIVVLQRIENRGIDVRTGDDGLELFDAAIVALTLDAGFLRLDILVITLRLLATDLALAEELLSVLRSEGPGQQMIEDTGLLLQDAARARGTLLLKRDRRSIRQGPRDCLEQGDRVLFDGLRVVGRLFVVRPCGTTEHDQHQRDHEKSA